MLVLTQGRPLSPSCAVALPEFLICRPSRPAIQGGHRIGWVGVGGRLAARARGRTEQQEDEREAETQEEEKEEEEEEAEQYEEEEEGRRRRRDVSMLCIDSV